MTNLEIIILLQKITGIAAFILITIQIFLSTNRKFIKYHMINGILAYTFVFIHPVLMLLNRYLSLGKIDPFYVYVDACVLCSNLYEYYINFGRIGFYLITIAVIAVKFKNINDWLKIHWRKVHILNYVAFYAVSIHAINIGTGSLYKPFMMMFWICQIVVFYAIVKKIYELQFIKDLIKKNNSPIISMSCLKKTSKKI